MAIAFGSERTVRIISITQQRRIVVLLFCERELEKPLCRKLVGSFLRSLRETTILVSQVRLMSPDTIFLANNLSLASITCLDSVIGFLVKGSSIVAIYCFGNLHLFDYPLNLHRNPILLPIGWVSHYNFSYMNSCAGYLTA